MSYLSGIGGRILINSAPFVITGRWQVMLNVGTVLLPDPGAVAWKYAADAKRQDKQHREKR